MAPSEETLSVTVGKPWLQDRGGESVQLDASFSHILAKQEVEGSQEAGLDHKTIRAHS